MAKRLLSFFISIVASVTFVQAHVPLKEGNRIIGHVIEKETEQNVPQATVWLVGTDKWTVSNNDGHFEFQGLKAGTYRVQVSALGYNEVTKEVTVDDAYDVTLHFQLEDSAEYLDEVVVSANRNEISRKDAPVVVSVLSDDLFETVNSMDLARSLNYQSGLRVENNCQNCGFPQVRINGLEGPYSQILINSRPVVSALSGVYGLEQIPVNMIERVEVVRGGGSALFGANAVGGTINIITKDPVSDSFQLSSQMSSMNGKAWEQYVGANASIVSDNNTFGIALYQSYRNRNPYDHDGDSFSEIGMLDMNTFGFRAYYRPSVESRLNFEYHTTNELRRGGNRFDFQPHEADIAEQTRHVINSGGLSYDRYWDNYAHHLSVYGSAQHIDRNSYYGAGRDPFAYGKTDDLTMVGGAMYVWKYAQYTPLKGTFTGGLEYQHNSLHDIMTGYGRDMQQGVRIASAYLQNEMSYSDFTLLLGGRFDRHNLVEKLIFSPRVNLLYKPSEAVQARLTYSTGFRAPQAYDEDLHITAVGGEGVVIQLADGLREERSNSFSGSVDYSFKLGHWIGNVLAEGFYTGLKDVFVLEQTGTDIDGHTVQERRNGLGARVYGANLDFKMAHGKEAVFQMGFTAQRSLYKAPEAWTEVDGTELTTQRMMRTPDYYGYFTFSSEPVDHFDFALSGTYTGPMLVPHYAGYIDADRMEVTPDFFDLNLKLNYSFILKEHLKLQLNAGIQNIFDAFQDDLDQGEFRDSGYFYGPTQPRTYFFGLKFMM